MNQPVAEKGAPQKSDFRLRLVSAIFMAVFTVFLTWIGGQTFFLFAAILSVLILIEFRGLVKSAMPPLAGFFAFAFLLLTIAAWSSGGLLPALGVMGVGAVVLFGYETVARRRPYGAIGLLYAAMPFIAMVDLRGIGATNFDPFSIGSGGHLVFILYGCVWGADSFAYLVGRSVGGPKLAPRLSPKKTWSGFIGSLVGGALIGAIAAMIFGYSPTVLFFTVMILIAVISQFGDLMESLVKRKFDKKDSGSLIPGHGGVLDRVDGLIFAAISLWIFAFLVTPDATTTSALPEKALKFLSFIM